MNVQDEIKELSPFAFEKQSMEQPESWMSCYLSGVVVCQTILGNHHFSLPPEEKEHFHYGETVEFEHLQDCEHIPEKTSEIIEHLLKITEELTPLSLAAVSMEDTIYTLYSTKLDTYFMVDKEQIPNLSPQTARSLAALKPTGFGDARYLRLTDDGHIIV